MGPVVYRLVDVHVTVTDFQIKSTVRVSANPGLILNCGSLAAEIRKRHQIPGLTFLTFGEIIIRFQRVHLPSSLINAVYNNQRLLARGLCLGFILFSALKLFVRSVI
jgi:hypothetical protein